MINGIVAVDKQFAIGKLNKQTNQGQLLFKLPKDLAAFKQITKNNIIVMGYSTYMSLPKRPLPDRITFVLWDKATSIDCIPECCTFNDFNALLTTIKLLAKQYNIYICGGGTLYKSMLPYYDEVVVNKVDAEDKEATVFFPNLDEDPNFELYMKCQEVEDNGYKTQLCVYKRRNN